MKAKLTILFVTLSFFAAFISCKKDELQPKYDRDWKAVALCDKMGDKAVEIEKEIDKDRKQYETVGYDSLENYAKAEMRKCWLENAATDIPKVIDVIQEAHRDHPNIDLEKIFHRHVCIDDEWYRVAPAMSERLLQLYWDYVSWYFNGPTYETEGMSNAGFEVQITNLIDSVHEDSGWDGGDPTYLVEWGVYCRAFAQDPRNKAQYQQYGFLNNFRWGKFKRGDNNDDWYQPLML